MVNGVKFDNVVLCLVYTSILLKYYLIAYFVMMFIYRFIHLIHVIYRFITSLFNPFSAGTHNNGIQAEKTN